jgi:alpha/beta superfamily hydrolase
LNDAGLVTLRINFRGVGHSTGTHDDGYGERDDVRRRLGLFDEELREPGKSRCAGFSFGARVGLEVGIADDRVARLISIGTPVEQVTTSVFSRNAGSRSLFVHGEHDEFGNVDRLRELVARVAQHAPAELKVIPGAGHFFDNPVG